MKNKFKFFVIYWLPVFVWSGLIYLFSSHAVPSATQIYWGDFIIKKSAHIFEYGLLALLWYRALKQSGVKKKTSAIVGLILAICYGITDEYHQTFTPGREPRIRDVVFDTIGATAALYIVWNLLPKAPKRLKDWAKKLDLL